MTLQAYFGTHGPILAKGIFDRVSGGPGYSTVVGIEWHVQPRMTLQAYFGTHFWSRLLVLSRSRARRTKVQL